MLPAYLLASATVCASVCVCHGLCVWVCACVSVCMCVCVCALGINSIDKLVLCVKRKADALCTVYVPKDMKLGLS